MVEMREIEALLAVAEELHFGRAADRLRVSTASVSQTIRALERRVGTRLFDRTSRHVRLTPIGEQLVAAVGPLHAQLVEAIADARHAAAARTAELLIGFSRSLPGDLVDAIRDGFEAEFPGSRIVPVTVNPLDTLKYRMRVGPGMAAVVGWFPPGTGNHPSPGMRAGPIIALSGPAVIVHAAHPIAQQESIEFEQLADLTFVSMAGMDGLAVPWVPTVTPAGRPILREERDLHYPEEIIAEIARERGKLAHLSIQDLPAAAWALGDLVKVPVTGWRPFEARAVWQASTASSAVVQFARAAADIGRAGGWHAISSVPRSTHPPDPG